MSIKKNCDLQFTIFLVYWLNNMLLYFYNILNLESLNGTFLLKENHKQLKFSNSSLNYTTKHNNIMVYTIHVIPTWIII